MALKLWKEKERWNLEQGSAHCTQALPVTWIHKRNSANDFEPVSHLKVCTLSTILSASEVHDYILTFELLLIMRTINILGRKRKLSNVGSVVRLTFGLSNLPSSDWHSHSYWGAEGEGCCALKEPLCVAFLRMKMDMLESETWMLEAIWAQSKEALLLLWNMVHYDT